MGYTMRNGEYADTKSVNLSPAAPVSANAFSNVIEMGARGLLRLELVSTAVVGTLNITIQGSKDGVTWGSLGTFTAMTAAGSERKLFMADRFVRASFLIGTGPSAFTLSGEAC